mmetsp:Transcript_7806/g.18409  ORF Transcript_7806/g.18409 Transcript_7806/m.18409 type:complete len:129 (-) Transcript_7806:112-498(-)
MVAGLQECTALAHLDLQMNPLGALGATSIASALQYWPHLRYLDLGHANIPGEGWESLGGTLHRSSALTCLRVFSNQIPDPSLAALARGVSECAALRELNVGGNDCGRAAKAELARLEERRGGGLRVWY